MKIILSLFFIWTVRDRLAAMFCVKKVRHAAPFFERLNSAFMIFLYAGIAFYGFFVMIFYLQVNLLVSSIGIILYMSSRLLRNAAIRTLGKQWNIYTSAASINELIRKGPFRYVRHPYYLATWGELMGYAFLFNSFYAGAATVVIFLPLLFWIRITVEEKEMVRHFQKEYRQYQNEVGLFFIKTTCAKGGLDA